MQCRFNLFQPLCGRSFVSVDVLLKQRGIKPCHTRHLTGIELRVLRKYPAYGILRPRLPSVIEKAFIRKVLVYLRPVNAEIGQRIVLTLCISGII